ncbi:hypothetical protein COT42_07415 [Candidatus Saganbacteria bacterium CG08_land_8_20_14_0_20_45_16]|uniref:Fe/B12 periplasmic-binding domain-containing protein n=1 Tax=Candidatus Saganbacteria bacterium CG08_land_8_20_14_0_20_45_16 TaxID=2014293 RepID=A0A2H0XUY3_UNCSA|nr:MAG: hypothetical protein COT42_07415 [Candidatus Saganbacteria bacterium CG08_land_8_20_14_0_20_45_16]
MLNDTWKRGQGIKASRHQGKYALLFFFLLFLICHLSLAIPTPPQRIISGIPAVTEMLFALGLSDRVVGVTTNCNYPPAALKKERIGGFFLNLEKVTSLKPDLVVMQADAQAKEIERFKEFGLPVYSVTLRSVDVVFAEMLQLGVIAGVPDRATQVVEALKQRLGRVEVRTKDYQPKLFDVLKLWNPKKKQRQALVIVALNPMIVAGENTFINDLLRYAGVLNVASGGRGEYPQYSFEKLVSENPQYLIMPQGLIRQEELASNSRWRSLEAVRQGRICFIQADILSRPGPRVVEAIEQIANFVYPQN